jgi:ketopantoate reductase
VLFDRFRFYDIAVKVVGVGSVGTMCGVALFLANEDDPQFLQIKEARVAVLERSRARASTTTAVSVSWSANG